MTSLTGLPLDILILIVDSLGVDDLGSASKTCRMLYSIVTEYGWAGYLRQNPRPSWTLSQVRSTWLPRTQARYNSLTDSAWSNCDFIARPLSQTWAGKLQPVLATSPSRLVVGAGSKIYSYASKSISLSFEGSASLVDSPDRSRNITALTFIDDDDDHTLHVAFQDGGIERIVLTSASQFFSIKRYKLPSMPNHDFIESLCAASDTTLSLSSTGFARLSSESESLININQRSWTSHLSLSSSTPYAAFGTASTTPLTIHPILQASGLSPFPSAILHTHKASEGPVIHVDKLPSSAVYGLSNAPLASPWGASPQIIMSGWYDGQVRIYDLRSPSSSSASPSTPPTSTSASASPAPAPTPIHTPVLSLLDRWSYEPIYSLSSGGGSAAHIAAGTARHAVISFWDVRSPATGWSVHAPGNDPSPVYSVVLESSRCFGVTQSRPFVYDFGPGVSLDTYPPIPQIRGFDGLKHKKGSHRATYHVLRYAHNSTGLAQDH